MHLRTFGAATLALGLMTVGTGLAHAATFDVALQGVDNQWRDACPPQNAPDARAAVQKCFAQGGLSFPLKNVSQVYPKDTRCTKYRTINRATERRGFLFAWLGARPAGC